jgi:hypothetical protein
LFVLDYLLHKDLHACGQLYFQCSFDVFLLQFHALKLFDKLTNQDIASFSDCFKSFKASSVYTNEFVIWFAYCNDYIMVFLQNGVPLLRSQAWPHPSSQYPTSTSALCLLPTQGTRRSDVPLHRPWHKACCVVAAQVGTIKDCKRDLLFMQELGLFS